MSDVVTKFCPSEWLEESAPILIEDPNAIIFEGGKTGWQLLADEKDVDEEDDGDDDHQGYRLALIDGDEVSFDAYRGYGVFLLNVRKNGTWSTDRPIPADATHFALDDGDDENMSDTIDELIRTGAEGMALEAGTHPINVWHWSFGYMYRFELQDRKPVLTYCGRTS
jgi:hypothetical protein